MTPRNWRGRILSAAMAAVALLAAAAPITAQNTGSIRGKVTDAVTARPLAGAQVFIPGTSKGTLTNATGDFLILTVDPGAHTLRVEMIGMGAQEKPVTVTAGGTAQVDFALSQSAISLDEVVVTGTPGATQRRAIGNTVSTINAADVVQAAPVTSIDQLLTARTTGLTVMAGAGTAGTAGNIRIRGANSLNAGIRPIFVVDGVRIQTSFADSENADFGVLGQERNPLNAINPEDIESIEVIKGPAASTLYGAEAASGVIQIITKKGRKGSQSVEFTAKAERGSTEWFLDHPVNWKECTRSMIGSATWPGCAGLNPDAPREERLLQDSPLERNGECAAWVANDPNCLATPAIRDGMLEGYNFSVRGGSERFSFFGSADQSFERGVFYNNQDGRKSGRINMQFTPLDNFDGALSVGFSQNNTRLPLNDNASNGLLRNAYRGEPGRTAAWEPGYLNLGPREINQVDNVTDDNRFIVSLVGTYRPFEWATSKLTVGVDDLSRLAYNFTARDTTGRSPFGADVADGQVQRRQVENQQYTIDFANTVDLEVNEDISSATSLGMQFNARRYHQLFGQGTGLVANTLNLVDAAAVTIAGEDRTEQNQVGFYAQEQVGWKNRLFITGALRFDDNSAFGQNFTWAVYPKISASYVISEEPFFNFDLFDELRLRAAFGKAGNAPGPFEADRTLEASVATLEDGTSANAISTDEFGNPDLKAESGQEFELGLDASLWENRAGVELTYYNQRTKDALMSINTPPSSGFLGNYLQNIGEIGNSGFELALFGSPVYTRNFAWDVRATLATNKNEMIRLGRDIITLGAFRAVQRHVDGYPLAGYWAVDVERDASGQPILTNGAVTKTDTAFIGSSTPTREIGLTNTLTLFGNLRLYSFIDYKGGHYLWSAREWWRCFNQTICEYRNSPEYTDAERTAYASGAERQFIDNADFIKLREVSLTYSLPQALAARIGGRGASFTLSGRNLGIWTKYDLGSDPELNFAGDDNFGRTDYMSVPMMRLLVASVTLNF